MPNNVYSARFVLAAALALAASIAACRGSTSISPADLPSDSTIPVELITALSFASVLAKAPMQDTARVAAVQGGVAVVGLLNQTAPCFSLSSAATRWAEHIVLRLTAKEAEGTCNTFAAGAFAYDVGVKGIAPGTYEVDVLHRVLFNDGRAAEAKVGAMRVSVR